MNKHAIFLDLDGTALSSHNHINQELIDTVGQLQKDGHKVFIATGRQFYSSIPFHQQLGLNTPLITLNGGAIYTQERQLLHRETMEASFMDHILHSPDFIQNTNVSFFDTPNVTVITKDDRELNHFFYAQMPGDLQPNVAFSDPVASNRAAFTDTVNVFAIIDKNKLDWAKDFLNTHTNSNPQSKVQARLVPNDITNRFAFCEYFPEKAKKSQGIAWMLEHLNLEGYKTMAFGDGSNDPDMLAFVDHGVAMKNGCEEVFEVANAVTKDTNVDNGVANYLRSYFL